MNGEIRISGRIVAETFGFDRISSPFENMKHQSITNEKLADMIKVGFEHVLSKLEKTATKEQLKSTESNLETKIENLNSRMVKVEIRLDNLEEEVSIIRKHQIAHTIYRDEFDKLSNRVKALEKLVIKHS